MKQDKINIAVLYELQEYARAYFAEIKAVNTDSDGNCALTRGQYSAAIQLIRLNIESNSWLPDYCIELLTLAGLMEESTDTPQAAESNDLSELRDSSKVPEECATARENSQIPYNGGCGIANRVICRKCVPLICKEAELYFRNISSKNSAYFTAFFVRSRKCYTGNSPPFDSHL